MAMWFIRPGLTPAVLLVKVFRKRAFIDTPTGRLPSDTEKCSITLFHNCVKGLVNRPSTLLFSDSKPNL